MRQPDDPGPVYRPSFWSFLMDRWQADWEANRYSVLTAICVCLAPALLILALAFLP